MGGINIQDNMKDYIVQYVSVQYPDYEQGSDMWVAEVENKKNEILTELLRTVEGRYTNEELRALSDDVIDQLMNDEINAWTPPVP